MFFVWHRLVLIVVAGAPIIMLIGRRLLFEDASMVFAHPKLLRKLDDCSSLDMGLLFSVLIAIVPIDVVGFRTDIDCDGCEDQFPCLMCSSIGLVPILVMIVLD